MASCSKPAPAPTPSPAPAQTSAPAATPTKEPVKEGVLKIGIITELTGPAAAWGIGARNGLQLHVDEVNANGGVVVQGTNYKLELIVEDDKLSGEAGVAAANKLMNVDKVFCLAGFSASPIIKAVQGVCEPLKFLMFTDGYSKNILLEGGTYTFRTEMTPDEIAPSYYKWFHEEHPDVTDMLFLTRNDETGWATRDVETGVWKEMGLNVIGSELFEVGTKDFSPIVAKVMAKKPQMVGMTATQPGDAALILKLFHEAGFKPYIVHTGGLGVLEDTAKIAGVEALEGAVANNTDFTSPNALPAIKDYYKNYMAKYDKWNDTGVWCGAYDQIGCIVAALEKAQSLNHDDLKRVMEDPSFRFQSIYGEAKFGGASHYGINHNIVIPIYISQIRNGEAVIVGKAELPEGY
jgi:branched-chain amino acid transport system substrate-binding protein